MKIEKSESYEPINYITCTSTKIVDAQNLNQKKKRCKIIPTCMINVFEEKEKKAPAQLKPVNPRGRPKGPFRSEQAVDSQKTRPSSPTLRVATPYDLQEESKRFERKMKRITRIQDPMVNSLIPTLACKIAINLEIYDRENFLRSNSLGTNGVQPS